MFTLELDDETLKKIINQLPLAALIKRLESKKYFVVHERDSENYVNIKKSIGSEAFYDLLVEAIEKEEFNLELLIGRVAMKKFMKKGEDLSKENK